MLMDRGLSRSKISRRAILGAAAAVTATPALAEECRIGPPPHAQGPSVWLDMDQVELDASYDQSVYATLGLAAAVKAAGKPVELIESADYTHFDMMESVGHPYGPNGRAALAMMKLSAA